MSETIIQRDRHGCVTVEKLGVAVTLTPAELVAVVHASGLNAPKFGYLLSLAQMRQIADMAASLDYAKNFIPGESPWRGDLAAQSADGHSLLYAVLGEDRGLVYATEGEQPESGWVAMKGAIA